MTSPLRTFVPAVIAALAVFVTGCGSDDAAVPGTPITAGPAESGATTSTTTPTDDEATSDSSADSTAGGEIDSVTETYWRTFCTGMTDMVGHAKDIDPNATGATLGDEIAKTYAAMSAEAAKTADALSGLEIPETTSKQAGQAVEVLRVAEKVYGQAGVDFKGKTYDKLSDAKDDVSKVESQIKEQGMSKLDKSAELAAAFKAVPACAALS